ncbi:CHASE3 domain-containing protein [uncultured Nevskia sp.]|uniref:CHASE3 domain-containing protein n=1 Tax=uncultured Nevskia sp. TaxID=228950 RepID=UPI0025CE75B7|nr:CHASE3 domain-containing protein [uncultured Nevskia sp.]
MKASLKATLFLGAVAAVILLVISVVLAVSNVRQLHDRSYWVAHTQDVIHGFDNLVLLSTTAESSQRGYLLTGEPRYLGPYIAAVGSVGEVADELQRLVADNPHQRGRFAELRQRIQARLDTLAELIDARKAGRFDIGHELQVVDRGKQQMDALRTTVDEMIAEERGLLTMREQHYEHSYQSALISGILSGLLSLGAIVSYLLLLRRHLLQLDAANQVIAEQAERLRTTLASIGDAVISTDCDAAITNMNAVAEELTGWPLADALGQPLDQVFRIINETSRKTVANPARRALSEGVIVGLANHTLLIARDGVERPIDDSAAPIRCKDGEIVGCVLVFRDVSEKRDAELRLERSERRLQSVMNAIPQKIFTARPNGDIDYFNPHWSEYTGLSAAQLDGWLWTQAIHPDDLAENVRVWQQAIDSGEPFMFEHRFRRADGEYRWHLSRAKALTDDNGEVLLWVGANTDIHEQKQTANELRDIAAQLSEADLRKNNFLAMLAHELRNPLAPIGNAVRTVQMFSEDAAVVQSTASLMERQVRQIVRLVDDLLDVSRISHGKIELRRESVELAQIIQVAVETCRPALDAAGHQLSVVLPSESVLLDADPARLAQSFGNLLNNACKYSEPGGHIQLTATCEGKEVVVSVKDTGIGIAADRLSNIFELFNQVDQSHERSQGGLGIGLTLVQQLIGLHGGSVRAFSEGPGQGSEFVVRLPVIVERLAEAPVAAASVEPKAPLSWRILVVDDNQDSAASLTLLLELSGNETAMAHDGLEALRIFDTFKPEVVLLDIGLPKLNGYEVARKIRSLPGGDRITLVALTGWGQEDDRRKTREAGFDKHLVKPANYAELTAYLETLRAEAADS